VVLLILKALVMLSFPEILVILIVAVIVLGPKRLPETARKLGRWIGLFKQASEEFKKELMTMDRAVNDTLNRATTDFDHLEPEVTQAFENVEATLTDLYTAATLPPEMTPDDVLSQAPVPGGLAQTPSQEAIASAHTADATASTNTLESVAPAVSASAEQSAAAELTPRMDTLEANGPLNAGGSSSQTPQSAEGDPVAAPQGKQP
jgi:Tat protein translocase TatB subunit